MNLQSIRIEFDKTTSLVPLLSTLTNGINLVQKLLILPNMSSKDIEGNDYYSYLQNKSITQISLEMIPLIGNIYAFHQKKLWDDPQFVLQQIQKKPSNFLRVSRHLQCNPQFLIQAYDRNKKTLDFISHEIQENSEEFGLGVISVCKKKREELQKKIEKLLVENEIYQNSKDYLQDNSAKESSEEKPISLELFYAHARKRDFSKIYDLLQDNFEKNKQTRKQLSEQTTRLQNLKIKEISNDLSKADAKIEEMQNIPIYLEAPGYILSGMNTLLNKGIQAASYLGR